jgi:hypothetical protein
MEAKTPPPAPPPKEKKPRKKRESKKKPFIFSVSHEPVTVKFD